MRLLYLIYLWIILAFTFPYNISFADSYSLQSADLLNNNICSENKNVKVITTFQDREKAEKFFADIRKLGLDMYICKDIAEDKKTVYKIFVKKEQAISTNSTSQPEKSGNNTVLQKPTQEKTFSENRISGNIFERKKRYFHPFLSVSGLYTDNIYNTSEAKKSDFITILTPGIWLAVPPTQGRFSLTDTSIKSPGGFLIENLGYEIFRRFHAFLSYQSDIELFSKNSSENNVQHRVLGHLEYNRIGGFSVELQDEFLKAHDDRGTGVSNTLDTYNSNLFNVIATYDTGRRLRFKTAYTNFYVSYDASRNNFMKRVDNSFSGAILYKIKPKTSLFLEYEFIDVEYNENVIDDSKEHLFWAGLLWDMTAKSQGMLKAGYGIKDFRRNVGSSKRNFILEASIDYRLTSKTALKMKAWRKTNETDIATSMYLISSGLGVGYTQKLSGKITGSMNLSYLNDRYEGDFAYDGEVGRKVDKYYRFDIGLQYEFRKWLNSEIGYIYVKRNSNFSAFDYSNNSIYFKVNSSI